MKKYMLSMIALVGLVGMNNAFGWKFTVENRTEHDISVPVRFMGAPLFCTNESKTIKRGDTVTFNAGECLLTEVGAKIYKLTVMTTTDGRRVESVEEVDASPYTSTGQRTYNKFIVTGPLKGKEKLNARGEIMMLPNGQAEYEEEYAVGRFIQ